MKQRRFLIVLLSFCLLSYLFADLEEVNPDEYSFYDILEFTDFTEMWFDDGDSYCYDWNETIDGNSSSSSLNIYVQSDVELLIENLDLSGYKEIVFYIDGAADIDIIDCTFNLKDGINFLFSDEDALYPSSGPEASITIDNCNFDFDFACDDVSHNQLFFGIDPNSPTGNDYTLKNVEIINSNFTYNFTATSTDIGEYRAIKFYRLRDEVSFSDITIQNNTIDFNDSERLETIGILFINLDGGTGNTNDFVNGSFYEINNNITIENNNMDTDSDNPSLAILIQGPYKDVIIEDNKMYNFGRVMKDGTEFRQSYPLVIYGARSNTTYSDDVNYVSIKNNVLTTRNCGISVNGSHIQIDSNLVELLDPTSYWQNYTVDDNRVGIMARTMDTVDPLKHIEDIHIANDTVLCNYENSATGIWVTAKNFNISNNFVEHPNNWGIMYYGEGGTDINLDIDSSYITSNKIDYGNQTINNLNNSSSGFNNRLDFSSIIFYRSSHTPNATYSQEYLNISNNELIKSVSIESINYVDGLGFNFIDKDFYNNIATQGESHDIVCLFSQGNLTDFQKTIVLRPDDGDLLDKDENTIDGNNSLLSEFWTYWDGTVNDNVLFDDDVDFAVSGDFNADYLDDIIFYSDNDLYQLENDGSYFEISSSHQVTNTGSIEVNETIPSYSDILSMLSGNFDNDDKDEVLVISKEPVFLGNNLEFSLLNFNTYSSIGAFSTSFGLGSQYYDFSTGDFNGDGISDIISLYKPLFGSEEIRVYLGSSSGTFALNSSFTDTTSLGLSFVRYMDCGDMNNDGYDDVVFLYEQGNPGDFQRILVLESDGTDFDVLNSSNTLVDASWHCVPSTTFNYDNVKQMKTGDFNNDGYADIITSYRETSTINKFIVFETNSTGTGFANGSSFDPENESWGTFNTDFVNLKFLMTGRFMDNGTTLRKPVISEEDIDIEPVFMLKSNYPNPFNPITTIEYEIPNNTHVLLSIYDMTGHLVETVVNENQQSGAYKVKWNASYLSSGMYIYRIIAGEYIDVKKCLLIK